MASPRGGTGGGDPPPDSGFWIQDSGLWRCQRGDGSNRGLPVWQKMKGPYGSGCSVTRGTICVRMAGLMLTRLLKAKLHHAVVTRTNPEYHGSITIDKEILKASGLFPYEAVLVADCENGNRFETYIIPGAAGSRVIEINGAAAKLSKVGNRVIVMAFGLYAGDEVEEHEATVLVLDRGNNVIERVQHRAMQD